MSASKSRASKSVVANPHRGEAKLGDWKLCLTMNALVEIEEAFASKDADGNLIPANLADLGEVLAKPTTRQVRTLLAALVRGGGNDLSDEEVGAIPFNMEEATKAIEAAFVNGGAYSPTTDGAAPGPN